MKNQNTIIVAVILIVLIALGFQSGLFNNVTSRFSLMTVVNGATCSTNPDVTKCADKGSASTYTCPSTYNGKTNYGCSIDVWVGTTTSCGTATLGDSHSTYIGKYSKTPGQSQTFDGSRVYMYDIYMCADKSCSAGSEIEVGCGLKGCASNSMAVKRTSTPSQCDIGNSLYPGWFKYDSDTTYSYYCRTPGASSCNVCTPSWTCGSWSSCSSGTQTRTCTDSNNCGVTTGKPSTSQSCTYSGCQGPTAALNKYYCLNQGTSNVYGCIGGAWTLSGTCPYGCLNSNNFYDSKDATCASQGCQDTTWTPDPSTYCTSVSFTQQSNCGNTRAAVGTKTSSAWSPDPSTICSGTTFTQTGDCAGTSRTATGTKTTGNCAPVSYTCTTNGGSCQYPSCLEGYTALSGTCSSGYQCCKQCTSHASFGCYGNAIWWADSCGNRESVKEQCTYGCTSGTICNSNPCTSHASSKCFENDIYYFDSCNSVEDKKEECTYGCTTGSTTCGTCTPSCTGKTCGSDGCGGKCGECGIGVACTNGKCEEKVCQDISWSPLPSTVCSGNTFTQTSIPCGNERDATGTKVCTQTCTALSIKVGEAGDAWKANPTSTNRQALLDAIVAWAGAC